MPKGVEHQGNSPDHRLAVRVSSSVMPKGVEHSNTYGPLVAGTTVSSSVMPKGVEHVTDEPGATGSLRCRVQ